MCNFSIPFQVEKDGLINHAKTAIEQKGGSFIGDVTNGSFEVKTVLGRIAGIYNVSGQSIAITVQKKPFLVTCKKIEKELNALMQ